MAMGSVSEHSEVNLLILFDAGMLSVDGYQKVENHLMGCERCSILKNDLRSAFQVWKNSGYKEDLSNLVRSMALVKIKK